jgi:F420-0:gamma-glutamyl ligase
MIVRAIKTPKVQPGSADIFELLDSALSTVNEGSIVVVTSKVVSICESRTIPTEDTDKEELIHDEADLYYFPDTEDGRHRYHFTIVHNTLIPASGIDESNGDGHYILWPRDPQKTANQICRHLKKRFDLKQLGVLITDSTIFPSRWGTLGIAIGYSGFSPVRNYIGEKDIFGREMNVSKANVAGGLAATAVLAMGEGAEQTPIALIEDIPFVDFKDTDPSQEEVDGYYVSPLNDEPFTPFFNSVAWLPGAKGKLESTR